MWFALLIGAVDGREGYSVVVHPPAIFSVANEDEHAGRKDNRAPRGVGEDRPECREAAESTRQHTTTDVNLDCEVVCPENVTTRD